MVTCTVFFVILDDTTTYVDMVCSTLPTQFRLGFGSFGYTLFEDDGKMWLNCQGFFQNVLGLQTQAKKGTLGATVVSQLSEQ